MSARAGRALQWSSRCTTISKCPDRARQAARTTAFGKPQCSELDRAEEPIPITVQHLEPRPTRKHTPLVTPSRNQHGHHKTLSYTQHNPHGFHYIQIVKENIYTLNKNSRVL